MVFTSPIAINKDNKFQIGPIGPGHNILVVIKECVHFNILQQLSMLVPTFTMSSEHLPSVELIPSNIECIKTNRLLDSCYKLEDNILIINIPREPKKIISCNIKNIKLKKNLIPSQLDDRFLAIAIFSYTIEITYIDYKKRTIIFKQLCPRYQRAFLNNTSGQLEINLNIKCIHSSIYPTMLHSY